MKLLHLVLVLAAAMMSSCNMVVSGFGVKNVKATGQQETAKYVFARHLDQIETAAGVEVVYTPSATGNTEVKVTTDRAMLGYIKVETEDDELKIYRQSGINGKGIKVTVSVTAPLFHDYEVSSGSSLTVTAPLAADGRKMSFDVSSGGSISLAALSAGKVDFEASSGGSLSVKAVQAKTIEAEASSGGSVAVKGINGGRIKAEASSGGSVTLAGTAESVKVDRSSGGSVDTDKLTVNVF